MKTLIELLEETATRYSQSPALVLPDKGETEMWSYSRLWTAALAAARYFQAEQGIAAGERLLVWAPNSPRLVGAYFGAMLAGSILVPLDAQSPQSQVESIVRKTAPKALLASGERPVSGLPLLHLEDIPFDAETGAPDRRPHAEEIAEIVFTSGSTGDPKGVALTHRNIIANIEGLQGMIPRGPHYRLLSVLPLSHMLEQTIGLYLPLTYGATVYYIPGRQASTIKRAMVEHRITSMVVVVPQALDLFLKAMEREVRERGRQKQWQLAHRLARYLPMSWRRLLFREAHKSLGGKLDFFLCGGAYLPADLAAAWERLGVRVIEGYGSTECAPVVTCNSYDRRVISSVGRPLRNLELRAAEDSELQVRGPSVFSGYWKDEQATKEAFSDGWYCTGDLGHLDKNGYVHLKGRKKDLIVLSSGLNVYPEDVEDELKRAEAIHDCVVLGLPNPSGEIRIHAVVLPAPSLAREQLDEALAAAIQRANARLATHQRVKDYSVWPGEDFPRTNTLKVKRHEVRREIEADAK